MHGLAGIVATVGDDAVAAGQSLLRGELRNDLKALGDHSGVFRRDGRDRVDVLLRDHEKVHRHLRIDVAERINIIIVVQAGGRDLPRRDLTKQAVVHNETSL